MFQSSPSTSSTLLASSVHSRRSHTPINEDSDSNETDESEFRAGCDEAKLVLEVVRAKRKVRHAEKHLADCVLEQHSTLVNLYRFKADAAERRLEDAELDIGRVRVSIRQSGLSLAPSLPRRRRRNSAVPISFSFHISFERALRNNEFIKYRVPAKNCDFNS
ncbi:hypothetical protein BV22DRAFT_1052767 [Leucogyrophana mollusca]|uniref:Uncharacterized protein n=1 Tax=Leucogyrophana mollusca TaxID=85980 RepID=A0ACB8AUS3_9AGAM|nr:hypothetical protein BV22DRAFT_1052767 [Leucogyrophana mollusca]